MIIDIIIIAILAFSIFWGYKKGLALMLINFVSGMLASLLAYMFSPALNKILIEKFDMFNIINSNIASRIKIASKIQTGKTSPSEIANNALVIPQNLKNNIDGWINNTSDTVITDASVYITEFILKIMSFAIIFISAIIIIKIITIVLDIVTKLPIIHCANHLGGAVFSLLFSYLLISVSLMLILSYASINKTTAINKQLKEAKFTKVFITHNPLINQSIKGKG